MRVHGWTLLQILKIYFTKILFFVLKSDSFQIVSSLTLTELWTQTSLLAFRNDQTSEYNWGFRLPNDLLVWKSSVFGEKTVTIAIMFYGNCHQYKLWVLLSSNDFLECRIKSLHSKEPPIPKLRLAPRRRRVDQSCNGANSRKSERTDERKRNRASTRPEQVN